MTEEEKKDIDQSLKTEERIKNDLLQKIKKDPRSDKPYGVKIFICENVDGLLYEVVSVSLRSEKPFTKENIEDFIKGDKFIDITNQMAEVENKKLETFYIISND